jgi:AcrR family transcriptional regulator
MHVFWRKGFLGTSLTDLTGAMRINRASLYAAFGNKEALFRKALENYLSRGPGSYLNEALQQPNARAVAERMLYGNVDLLTNPEGPGTCLWVHGALSCGDDPIRKEFAAQRAAGLAEIRKRFQRAVREGDLPKNANVDSLARFVQTVNFGLTVQASTGETKRELLRIVEAAMKVWPGSA